jgi:hypothetical protein
MYCYALPLSLIPSISPPPPSTRERALITRKTLALNDMDASHEIADAKDVRVVV